MSRSAPMRMSRATAFLDSCVLLEAKGPLFLSMVGKKEQTRGGFFIKPYSGSSVLPFINTAVFWFGTLKTQSNILAYETISSISPKVTDCSPAKHSTWSKGVIGKLLTANTRQTSAAITLSMGMWIRTWDWNWAQKTHLSICLTKVNSGFPTPLMIQKNYKHFGSRLPKLITLAAGEQQGLS